MRRILARIENTIQQIIEGSIQILPWSSQHKTVAIAIFNDLKRILCDSKLNQTEIPDNFSIAIHQDIYNSFASDTTWLTEIQSALTECICENHDYLTPEIKLRFFKDNQLKNINDYNIQAFMTASQLERTTAYEVDSKESKVQPVNANGYLLLPDKSIFNLNLAVTRIGRKSDNNLVIDNPAVSRDHAQIRFSGGGYILFDLNSTSGTMVNGIKINQVLLQVGDVIHIANYPMVFGEETILNQVNFEITSEIDKGKTKK